MNATFSSDSRCALSASDDNSVRLWDVGSGQTLRILQDNPERVLSAAVSPDGRRALVASDDNSVRLWDLDSGQQIRILQGHSDKIWSVAFSPVGSRALSASADTTMRLWDLDSGQTLRILEGHPEPILHATFSPNGCRALSASADSTMRLWDVDSGQTIRVLQGHSGPILSAVFSPDGHLALSASLDRTVRLWDVNSGQPLRILEGHSEYVASVAFSPDNCRALSASADQTVRLWDLESGHSLGVLEGHSAPICSASFSSNGGHAFSVAENGVLRIWDLSAHSPVKPATQYTNAKVLLVGDSGAGKTGLSHRLAKSEWVPSDSTVGAWASHWKLPVTSTDGIEREIYLWDFGGQADQRLIHQLYMDDSAAAVLVFDGQKEDLFESLGQWDRDLTRASGRPFKKLLAAGRTDASALRISRTELEKFAADRGFESKIHETSAKTTAGCDDLKRAILDAIDWDKIVKRTSPRIFKRLKEEIVKLKDEGCVLMRTNELRDALRLRMGAQKDHFTDEELKTVITLLSGPGVVWELEFGSWVLLKPEMVNAYGQALIATVRADPSERGCILEDRVLSGNLTYQSSAARLEPDDERIVLQTMVQTLIARGLCLREPTAKGNLLIFPSYYRRERPEITKHPAVLVTYKLTGFLDDIYATLVVRLHHTEAVQQDQLWRYAADFKTHTGKQLGIKLTRKPEGAGELDLYFDPAIPDEEKIIFARCVHDHLQEKTTAFTRIRHYVCPHCGTPVGNPEVAMKRIETWVSGDDIGQQPGPRVPPTILCIGCEKRFDLFDELERLFFDINVRQRALHLQAVANNAIVSQSKHRAMIAHIISTADLADQDCHENPVPEHGIDLRIELRDDAGQPTGRAMSVIISPDFYVLRRNKNGDTVVFLRLHQVAALLTQPFPIFLLHRLPSGEIEWMEIRDSLLQQPKTWVPEAQFIFTGERFDVMSIRRWRDRVLNRPR